jgi:cytidyltransferase-like protein
MEISKTWTLFLGRFQPPHEGHFAIVQKLLDEGKNVVIGLRKADGTDKNPYPYSQREGIFMSKFIDEIRNGTVKITHLPDIAEVVYGRTPGWKIREIRLDPELEKISGTNIRKK